MPRFLLWQLVLSFYAIYILLSTGVECGEVIHDMPLGEGERRPRVAVVSRGVGGRAAFSCSPGWALRGAPETVCLPAADWAKPFPVCRGKDYIAIDSIES